jgi:hypothetical protein
MWLPEAARSVRLRSASERVECEVSGGNEARAATAARNRSPRGPGVLIGAGSLRKPSSARSCRVDCRAGAEESLGIRANLGRSVQIGILAVNDLARGNRHHSAIPRPHHPGPLFAEGDIHPTTWASPARAQRGSGASPCWEVAKASVDVREPRERTVPGGQSRRARLTDDDVMCSPMGAPRCVGEAMVAPSGELVQREQARHCVETWSQSGQGAGGQKARAASAAGDGSPRGPVVLAGGARSSEPSSSRASAAGASGEDQVSSAEPKPGAEGELVAAEGVGPRATFARGVEGRRSKG